jgi:hemoglobin
VLFRSNQQTNMNTEKTLYQRLGGYDAIAAVCSDLLPRLRSDPQLGRFWAHRSVDGVEREKQLLINFLCANAGGPVLYTGRNMTVSHKGMRISESDWNIFLGHASATLTKFAVPERERQEVVAFVNSTKAEIVEC